MAPGTWISASCIPIRQQDQQKRNSTIPGPLPHHNLDESLCEPWALEWEVGRHTPTLLPICRNSCGWVTRIKSRGVNSKRLDLRPTEGRRVIVVLREDDWG